MRRPLIAIVLLLSCTAAPVTTASPPTMSLTPTPAATAAASPSPASNDLKLAPAGDIRADHVLVAGVLGSSSAGVASQPRIWDVPLDGGPPRQLVAYTRGPPIVTDFDYFEFSRQLSRDGRQLVLADPVDVAGTALLVVDLITGTARNIPIGGGATQPAWSPDGQRIAYRGFTVAGPFQKESGIWVVPASGGTPRQVMASDRPAGAGATTVYGWTEDGAAIAFARDYTDASVVEITTGKITRLGGATQGIAWRTKQPSVAIVFDDQPGTANAARVGHVEVRDTTTSVATLVARYGPSEGTFFLAPQWNPRSDDLMLLWASGQGLSTRNQIVIVDNVTAQQRLTTTTTPRSAAWSADGTRIVYGDLTAMHLMNRDGSDDRELFRPAAPPGVQQFLNAVTAFAPR